MTQQVTPETALGDFEVGRLSHGAWHYDLERDGDTFWVRFFEPALGGLDAAADRVLDRLASHAGLLAQPRRRCPRPGPLPVLLLEGGRALGAARFGASSSPRSRVARSSSRSAGTCAVSSVTAQSRVRTPARRRWTRRQPSSASPVRPATARADRTCGRTPGTRCAATASTSPTAATTASCSPHGYPRSARSKSAASATGSWCPSSLDERIRSFESGYRYRPGNVLAESGRSVLRGGTHASDPEIVRAREIFTDIDLDTSFWSDGMARVPREYNALLESPCFQRGEMTCQSCHAMHQPAGDPRRVDDWADDQLTAGMRGDAACLQCHAGFASELEAHTHHAPESEGSRCQNCHMPYTAYALLKAIRSTRSTCRRWRPAWRPAGRTPATPAISTRASAGPRRTSPTGTDSPAPELDDEQERVAAAVLWMLAGDAAQRALVAWHAGWEPARRASGGDWLAPHLAQLLDDPYPAVRYLAWRSLRRRRASATSITTTWVAAPARAEARSEAWRRWSARARPPGERAQALLARARWRARPRGLRTASCRGATIAPVFIAE